MSCRYSRYISSRHWRAHILRQMQSPAGQQHPELQESETLYNRRLPQMLYCVSQLHVHHSLQNDPSGDPGVFPAQHQVTCQTQEAADSSLRRPTRPRKAPRRFADYIT
ncbi:hypothetical protein MTO96_034397 [Rhipicephalus appendiculatus]